MSRQTSLKKEGKEHRFPLGEDLIGDKQGVLLVTYAGSTEASANRVLEVLGDVPVLEICTGIGGGTVILSRLFSKVITIDQESSRLKYAKKNVGLYGNLASVTFLEGNALEQSTIVNVEKVEPSIQCVFSDVDWREDDAKDLKDTVHNLDDTRPSMRLLYKSYEKFTKNWVMHLPKTISRKDLNVFGEVEVEECYYDGTIRFVNVYTGELFRKSLSKLYLN